MHKAHLIIQGGLYYISIKNNLKSESLETVILYMATYKVPLLPYSSIFIEIRG